MRIGSYTFSPRLVPTLVTAVLLPFLMGLGVWQLGRANEKQLIEQTFARQAAAPPVKFDATYWQSLGLEADMDALAYRRVTIHGRFEGDRQYLLDNRTHNGVAGFQVLTAFFPDGAGGGILINRGWVPLGERRDQPPAIPVPSSALSIDGSFDRVRTPPPLLGPSGYEQPHWPKIVQRVEFDRMAKQLGISLLPQIVLLDPDAPGGFVRKWKPYYGISVDRHRAYAFQWFALATALAVIYIVVNLKRSRND